MRVSTTTLGIFTIIWGECYFTAGWDWESQHTHTEGFFPYDILFIIDYSEQLDNLPTYPLKPKFYAPDCKRKWNALFVDFFVLLHCDEILKIVVLGNTKINVGPTVPKFKPQNSPLDGKILIMEKKISPNSINLFGSQWV